MKVYWTGSIHSKHSKKYTRNIKLHSPHINCHMTSISLQTKTKNLSLPWTLYKLHAKTLRDYDRFVFACFMFTVVQLDTANLHWNPQNLDRGAGGVIFSYVMLQWLIYMYINLINGLVENSGYKWYTLK
jgi:hypothetical protein